MSLREIILGSIMVIWSSVRFLSQIKSFNISSGISEVISRLAVEGDQTMDSKLLKFSWIWFATCLIMLSIDIPQKFTSDPISEPLFHASCTIALSSYLYDYKSLQFHRIISETWFYRCWSIDSQKTIIHHYVIKCIFSSILGDILLQWQKYLYILR